ncbi:MAG: restriction endonuclease subunit S, partial [Bacteroidales bacterium]
MNWTIFKLKYLVRLINKKVTSNEVDYPYIGLENIQSWKGKLYKDIIEYNPDVASNSFQKEDVLFGKLRPYLAKAFIANFDGLCSSELLVLRGEKIYNKFLLYFLLSKNFISVVDSSTYGSKMPRANWTFIGNLKLTKPPLPEQKSIAHFLDRETSRIDALIEKKRKLIELLKEKRTALITRAVTKGLDPNVKMKDSGIEWL